MPPRLIASVLVCVLGVACSRKAVTPPDVVVRIGERMLTLADFKRYLERNAGTDLSQLTAEVSSAMLDQLVEEIIISEHAAATGVEVPAEKIAAAVRADAGSTVIEKRDEMRRELLVAKLATAIGDATPAQVQTFYEQHLRDFQSGEEVRVRQILLNDEAVAAETHQKLKAGAPFAELSVERSRAPNAKRGGEIGYVSRGELPKVFEEAIFRLQPGEISDVIRTDSSFHIFTVEDRRPPGQADLESATPIIMLRLKEDAIRERISQIVSRRRRGTSIAVLTRRLPFKYTGSLPTATAE